MNYSKPDPQAPNPPPHNALPWRRYTAQFTYTEIASHLGICTKTVQRYIHDLIAHRLLALVRSGKSAPYSSTRANEAPIYTLLVPVGKNIHPLKTFKKSVKSLKDNTQKFSLTAVVESASDRWKTTKRLKEEVLDLRKVPTVLLMGHMRTIFAAGWCVKDVLVALEQSPEGEVYQSRRASNHRFHSQTQIIEHIKRWCRVPRPGTTNTHIYTSIRDPCKKYTLSYDPKEQITLQQPLLRTCNQYDSTVLTRCISFLCTYRELFLLLW